MKSFVFILILFLPIHVSYASPTGMDAFGIFLIISIIALALTPIYVAIAVHVANQYQKLTGRKTWMTRFIDIASFFLVAPFVAYIVLIVLS